MDALYVCHFSSGHIKVGRSSKPSVRINAHADRLRCAGIALIDKFITECVGPAAPRETLLIARCVQNAAERLSSEWFAGLQFREVCGWAEEFARHAIPEASAAQPATDSFGARLAERRSQAGLSQQELGRGLGTDGADCGKQVVYGWEKDHHHPRVDQLILICRRLKCSADYLLFGVVVDTESAIPA